MRSQDLNLFMRRDHQDHPKKSSFLRVGYGEPVWKLAKVFFGLAHMDKFITVFLVLVLGF